MRLFHKTADSVPAYSAFLAEHNIDAAAVRKFSDFQKLPMVTKQNYLQRHPLPDLCRNGSLAACDMVAVSSGSTGKPTFWPRFVTDELSIATRFEQIFHDSFHADERKTLAVVCFALGTWVGGLYTMGCCRHLATKGYPITIIAPGNNKDEIFRVVQELGPHFDQVVMLGYPPFLKDVIDTGRARGIVWDDLKLKFVLAGEVFSEEWRELMGERTGSSSPCYDSSSLYGTADAGVLGNETPLSICIRRFLASRPEVARELFGESRLPTLVQYDPLSRFFEVHDGTLLFSGDNGVPLVRYHISDQGGTMSHCDMMKFLAGHGFDPVAALSEEVGATGAKVRGIHPLPFVWVFGRSHFTISYFGANIYPENVTVGLEQAEIKEWVTGKFVLQAGTDSDENRFLSVAVEMAPGIEEDSNKHESVTRSIETHLLRLNSEFAHYVPPEYRTPRVALIETGHAEYFPVGVKHRYTRA